MKMGWIRAVSAALVCFALAGAAHAQLQTGNLYGTVEDTNGTALPGVTLTVSGLGAPLTQASNAEGQFRFLGLSPGTYHLQAELAGFSSVDFSDVVIGVGRNTTIAVTLNAAVEETITVTTASPILDERSITTGRDVTSVELEKVPSSRDPWGVLVQTPGVQLDRINVGGNESGQQSVFAGRGANSDANTYAVDGVDITDMAAIASPTYFDFDAFEELQITTGGSDVTVAASGVTLNVVTKRGSNEWRGSGRLFETDGSWQADPDLSEGDAGHNFGPTGAERVQDLSSYVPNSIDDVEEYGAELGGALWRDHLWIWGAYGENDIKNVVGGGQVDGTLLENYNAKLNFQIGQNNSGIAQYSYGDKLKDGRGAGPTRAPETTTDQSGPAKISKIEDTHVFGSNFYLTGLYSLVDGGFQLIPKGGFDADVWNDSDGVYHGSYYFLFNNRDVTQYRVDGSAFAGRSSTSHELRFGAGYREAESDSQFGISRNKITYECGVGAACVGLGDAYANFYRESSTITSTEYTQAWLQDTLTAGRLTANIGLRYEVAEGANKASSVPAVVFAGETAIPGATFPGDDGGGVKWQTLLPRLGLTWSLGEERRTLLRANYSRFAEQLPQGYISGVNPTGTAILGGEFNDTNDNGILDPAEYSSFVPYFYRNLNPDNLGSLESPNRIDPDLSPALTDEVNVAFDHSLLPDFVIGGGVTFRRVTNLPELRELVVDESSGAVRVAEPGDYVQTSGVRLSGDSPSHEYVWYELRDGIHEAGGALLASGDRGQDYWGVNLSLNKRLSNRWMARGSVVYSDWTWDVPDSYFAHHNPTNFGNGSGVPGFGSALGDAADGNRDGEVSAERSSGSGLKGDVLLNARWSYNVTGLYQVAPDRPWGFNVSGALSGRQGYPNTKYRNVGGTDGVSRAVQRYEDNDHERLEDIMTLDLRLEKEFTLGRFGVIGSVECFNVLNENTVLQRDRNQGSASANYIRETVSPRAYRAGLRLRFN